MDELIIAATPSTPYIHLQSTGEMEISGKSIMDAPDEFWTEVKSWFADYLLHPAATTCFKIQIDYLNTSSSKELLHLLYSLNELAQRGFTAKVEWSFHQGDRDMQEVGKDYEHMVQVPFEFHLVEEALLN